MTSDPDLPDLPLRWFPAHWGVAILAIGGALAMQFAWPSILGREPAVSWWPLDAGVVVAATGYLLTTAWMHATAASWRPNELLARLWRLARAHVADVSIALLAGDLLVRGPETSMLRSGLWLTPPVLITVAVASLIVGGLALREGFRRLTMDAPPASVPPGRPQFDILRVVLVILLFVALIAIERFEPRIKPWEKPVGERSSEPVTSHSRPQIARASPPA